MPIMTCIVDLSVFFVVVVIRLRICLHHERFIFKKIKYMYKIRD